MSGRAGAKKQPAKKVAAHKSSAVAKPSQALKQQFSKTQTAGKSTSPCPLRKPCNLVELKIVEAKSDFQDEHGKTAGRSAVIRKGQQLNRKANPVLLAEGGIFQITAPSPVRNEPRELEISVVSSPGCPGKKHPDLHWAELGKEGRKQKEELTTEIKASYFRRQLAGDTNRSFFFMLNSAFMGPDTYPVRAESCGVPQGSPGVPAPTLVGSIQVFPGDQFTGAFTLPPYKKKDLVDDKSEGWERTRRAEQKKEIDAAGARADAAYAKQAANPLRSQLVSKQAFHDHQVAREKAALGYHEDNEANLENAENIKNGLKIKLTQKDGDNSFDANFDDIIKLYRLKTNAVYAMKEIYSWIDKFPQPPGASFKIDVDFLTGSLSAIWGYKEYSDDRVFMAIKGKFSLELFKITLEANFGIKCGGAADAFLFLRAEGSLTLSASIARDKPEEVSPPALDVAGEIKVSGGISGQAMWVVKVEGKIETAFSAETEGLYVFKHHAVLDGTVTLKRDDITRTVTSSCWLFGSSTEKTVLVKEARTKFPLKPASAGKA